MLSLLLIAGAVLANVAFVGLGAIFDYPDVLQRPAPEVLAAFHADPWRIGGLFLLLALGAGLLAPISLRMARLVGPGRRATALAVTGVAAAAVQVVGLLRWPLVVPFLDSGDADLFRSLNTVLGQVIGESFGYALTAWLLLLAVDQGSLGRLKGYNRPKVP